MTVLYFQKQMKYWVFCTYSDFKVRLSCLSYLRFIRLWSLSSNVQVLMLIEVYFLLPNRKESCLHLKILQLKIVEDIFNWEKNRNTGVCSEIIRDYCILKEKRKMKRRIRGLILVSCPVLAQAPSRRVVSFFLLNKVLQFQLPFTGTQRVVSVLWDCNTVHSCNVLVLFSVHSRFYLTICVSIAFLLAFFILILLTISFFIFFIFFCNFFYLQ